VERMPPRSRGTLSVGWNRRLSVTRSRLVTGREDIPGRLD
jgi:hypothetical protein